MSRISIEKRVPKYRKIYEQIFENPSIPLYQITKSTGISRSTVSRYLIEMYDLAIMKGPMIFVKPAKNYHQYASFLIFEDPLTTYQSLKAFPYLVSRSLVSGTWNLLLICEKLMDFSVLKGFRRCILQGVRGVTHLSKVTTLDWDTAVKRMYKALSPPTATSFLYEEASPLTWEKEEWALYHKFKYNIRIQAMPVLKECNIRYERYQKWGLKLLEAALIQPAFYPAGLPQYFMFDFLFESEYQEQLADILGMLPSTAFFFSVGRYLLARLSLLNKREKDDLFSLIFRMRKEGYFTDFYQTMAISTESR
ncbi:MAG: hypothetical protein HXS46_04430 [Theionarchaea archaeon]|nr:hypothetical protein [Theionarchaea archaeon]